MATALHYNAATNNMDGVERCYRAGENLDEKDSNQFTPMHWAAMYGHLSVLKYLCEKGANKFIHNDNGNTPLLLAAEKGFIDIVKYLVEEGGCDIDVRNKWLANPLQMACVFGNIDIVKYLIEERGARLDVRNKYGATPLHFAFAGGQTEIIRYLMVRDIGSEFQWNSHEGLNFFLARRFVKATSQFPGIGLEYVLLLPIDRFLAAGEMPLYSQCRDEQWHARGTAVNDASKVLAISHRWSTPHHPDPNGTQYALICRFLETCEEEFDYIWLDYCCITQDKADADFSLHLANIPTALIMATHCLAVPQVDANGYTDLRDYLNRGWCNAEVIICMFGGSKSYCVYQAGEEFFCPLLVPYRGTYKAGFDLATQESMVTLAGTPAGNQARSMWGGPEPTESLKRFTDAVIVCNHQYQQLFENIMALRLSEDDIAFMGSQDEDIFLGPRFLAAYDELGSFTNEGDRIKVAGLLMFSIAHCMFDLGGRPGEDEASQIAGEMFRQQSESNAEVAAETISTLPAAPNQEDAQNEATINSGMANLSMGNDNPLPPAVP